LSGCSAVEVILPSISANKTCAVHAWAIYWFRSAAPAFTRQVYSHIIPFGINLVRSSTVCFYASVAQLVEQRFRNRGMKVPSLHSTIKIEPMC